MAGWMKFGAPISGGAVKGEYFPSKEALRAHYQAQGLIEIVPGYRTLEQSHLKLDIVSFLRARDGRKAGLWTLAAVRKSHSHPRVAEEAALGRPTVSLGLVFAVLTLYLRTIAEQASIRLGARWRPMTGPRPARRL